MVNEMQLDMLAPVVPPGRRQVSRDWTNQTNALLDDAKVTKQVSTKLRAGASATRRAVDKQTKERQQHVDEALRKKVQDTTALKNKLERRIRSLQQELDKLVSFKERATAVAGSLHKPINKAEKRLTLREKKPTRERIFDRVEKTLSVEHEELKKALMAINALINESGQHIVLMGECRHILRLDLADKAASLKLDLACLDLPSKNGGGEKLPDPHPPGKPHQLPMLDQNDTVMRSTTAPATWRQGTEKGIAEACKLEHQSYDLRKKIVVAMHNVEETKTATHSQVVDALGNKVKQTAFLQGKLNQNMLDINAELDSLDEQRGQVVRALQAKEQPLSIVKDRLRIRKSRPIREAVRDSVEEALEEEYGKLCSTIKALKEKLVHIDEEKEKLLHAQRHLNQDIKDKNQSLGIDKRCLDLDQQSCTTAGMSLSHAGSRISDRTPMQSYRQNRAIEYRKQGYRPGPPPAGGVNRIPHPPR
eukprot:TRINITY_DN27713_c0_g1_i1.p1 TRINITY_DN27713_c0_g1~~TRINITY_DN27713_c0_g1_i1.p1  ORF type:complete len:476 (+),score=206.68 TRINITY_DN27713_c0_g1_i1:132-1559(+)